MRSYPGNNQTKSSVSDSAGLSEEEQRIEYWKRIRKEIQEKYDGYLWAVDLLLELLQNELEYKKNRKR